MLPGGANHKSADIFGSTATLGSRLPLTEPAKASHFNAIDRFQRAEAVSYEDSMSQDYIGILVVSWPVCAMINYIM